ncbi:MAG: polyprenyl synthetase family protein [Saprospiraceae bacterium]
MAITLRDIQAPVKSELKQFEGHFKAAMKSSVPLLDKITNHILRRKGKQIRPLFVFLTAGLAGEIQEQTYHAASLVELLHTATLVHDDVVDDSQERRGFFSLQALWGKKIAVLVGDYLLSRGLLLALDNNAYRLLHILSVAVREMSEGELLQIQKARRLDITEDVYFEVIRKKTASLIAAACCAGAASVGSEEANIEKARLMGEKAGIAFQIKDDLLDFGEDDIGKPLGIDIKEKKMTLPLIYALQEAPAKDRRRILRLIKSGSDDPKNVKVVVDFVRASGGIAYARKRMDEHLDDARTELNGFPESPFRDSLHDLLSFVTERKK